jgi:hypothetical protein
VTQAAYIVAEAVLAIVFSWAALSKIWRPRWWRGNLASYRLPSPVYRASLAGIPWLELAVAACFVGGAPKFGAVCAVALLVLFSWAIVRARRTQDGNLMGCACFGGTRRYDYRLLLARNAVLAGASIVALVTASAAVPGRPSASLIGVLGAIGCASVAWTAWLGSGNRRSESKSGRNFRPRVSRP